jgi:PadR family transcriptional regulator PadR
MARKTNPDFMTGVPELLVLKLLGEREMYGYELVQAIERATNAAIKLGEGVVYPTLYALEQRGCLKSRKKVVDGRTRIYYAATAAGEKQLTALAGEWRRITAAISTVVEGEVHAYAI